MIKLIPIALISIMLCACGLKLYPLKGQYAKDATAIRQYPSEKKDEVWTRIMTYFAANDIAIKTIDKNAGFIKSERLDLKPYVWGETIGEWARHTENKYIVSVQESEKGEGSPPMFPRYIAGAIKIFTIDSLSQIQIRVSLDDMASSDTYYGPDILSTSTQQIYSLGKLENEIADYLTGKGEMPKSNFKVVTHVF
jgi:hypothetical protein